MDCEVWVRMPPFWGKDGDEITGVSSDLPPRRLLKGVPGIPQGSRLFYETFGAELKLLGYLPSTADKCLFLNRDLPERTAFIVWVDDFIFMHENEETWTKTIARLRKRFSIPTAGPLTCFLGMEIRYNPEDKTMFLCQSNTVQVLLDRAGLSDCNPGLLPCQVASVFSTKDCPTPTSSRCTEYRSLVALANFLACWTRPDIAFVVNKLCKFMANPGELHWQMLKYLIRYLKGTKSKGLLYKFGTDSANVHGYADSSHADCPDTSKSTLGYVFYFGRAILSWHSKLHSYVTTCTNHSEYAALFLGAKEAQWLVYLFDELDAGQPHNPIPSMWTALVSCLSYSTRSTTNPTSMFGLPATMLVSSPNSRSLCLNEFLQQTTLRMPSPSPWLRPCSRPWWTTTCPSFLELPRLRLCIVRGGVLAISRLQLRMLVCKRGSVSDLFTESARVATRCLLYCTYCYVIKRNQT